MLYRTYRYSRWDGTQNIFDIDADELMDLLSDDILNRGDIMQALRDLFRQGMQNRDGEQMPGLRQLMEQLKERRRQQMQQHNMDSVLDDLKERLQDIIDTERRAFRTAWMTRSSRWSRHPVTSGSSRRRSTISSSRGQTATWRNLMTSPRAWAANCAS